MVFSERVSFTFARETHTDISLAAIITRKVGPLQA